MHLKKGQTIYLYTLVKNQRKYALRKGPTIYPYIPVENQRKYVSKQVR